MLPAPRRVPRRGAKSLRRTEGLTRSHRDTRRGSRARRPGAGASPPPSVRGRRGPAWDSPAPGHLVSRAWAKPDRSGVGTPPGVAGGDAVSPLRLPSGAPPRPGPESAVSRAPSRPRGRKPRGQSRVAVGQRWGALLAAGRVGEQGLACLAYHVPSVREAQPCPLASRGGFLLPGCRLSLDVALDSQRSRHPVPAGAVAVGHRRGQGHTPVTPTAPGPPAGWAGLCWASPLTAAELGVQTAASSPGAHMAGQEFSLCGHERASRPPRAMSEGGRGLRSLPRGVTGLKTQPSGSQGRLAQGSSRCDAHPSASRELGRARAPVLPTRGASPARAESDVAAWPGRDPDIKAQLFSAGSALHTADAAEAPGPAG